MVMVIRHRTHCNSVLSLSQPPLLLVASYALLLAQQVLSGLLLQVM